MIRSESRLLTLLSWVQPLASSNGDLCPLQHRRAIGKKQICKADENILAKKQFCSRKISGLNIWSKL